MSAISLKAPVPCLRIFDESKAMEFYLDYLGFTKDWDHRFEPHFPVYVQVSRGACVLHLSEHHGDACPGSLIRIDLDDIDALHKELMGKAYRMLNPSIEKTPWGTRDMSLTDPFGNKLTFSVRQKT